MTWRNFLRGCLWAYRPNEQERRSVLLASLVKSNYCGLTSNTLLFPKVYTVISVLTVFTITGECGEARVFGLPHFAGVPGGWDPDAEGVDGERPSRAARHGLACQHFCRLRIDRSHCQPSMGRDCSRVCWPLPERLVLLDSRDTRRIGLILHCWPCVDNDLGRSGCR